MKNFAELILLSQNSNICIVDSQRNHGEEREISEKLRGVDITESKLCGAIDIIPYS